MKTVIILVTIFITSTTCAQTIETEVIKKINELRLELGGPDKGLSMFVRNAALDSAAMYHAKWLVASGLSGHIETKSVSGINALPDIIDRAAKYHATAFAENLIVNCIYYKVNDKLNISETANIAYTSWKNSPGHYANMVLQMPKTVEARIGIAIVPQDNESFCIVMVVGANIDASGQLIK